MFLMQLVFGDGEFILGIKKSAANKDKQEKNVHMSRSSLLFVMTHDSMKISTLVLSMML